MEMDLILGRLANRSVVHDHDSHRRNDQIPVRLDFDTFAAGFARAMAHLDQAATKELDRASSIRGCAS